MYYFMSVVATRLIDDENQCLWTTLCDMAS